MKAVMKSVSPRICEKVANGNCTILVSKTAPKCEEPFKCYIYCTKASKKYQTICGCMVINTDELYRLPNGEIKHDWSGELMCCNGEYTRDNFLNGKVIGEFVCDKVYNLVNAFGGIVFADENLNQLDPQLFRDMSCLTDEQTADYLGDKDGYGWHISDLKIYGKPKELSEFYRPCSYSGICYSCNRFRPNGTPNDKPNDFCDGEITRPPQSWFYVEEL